MNELRALFSTLVALGVIAIIGSMLPWGDSPTPPPVASVASTSVAAAATPLATTTTAISSKPLAATIPQPASIATPPKPESAPAQASSTLPTALRIENPYDTPPLSFEEINTAARAALVNIQCTPKAGGLSPISGSGVIIDPKGIVLTNAHVAQYVLLSESAHVDLTCTVRMGAPAMPRYTPHVLALSNDWVASHAAFINTRHTQGTGEHDWALLQLTPLAANPTPLPASFPFLSFDTRQAIGFPGDQVLAAGYPAEFIGGSIALRGLYPVSSVSMIDQLLTLKTGSVDLVSIGSVIEAQGGSSGGPIVNDHGKLIAIITTTSDGATTAERNLRGLALSYINIDVTRETGQSLAALLDNDVDTLRTRFVSSEDTLLAPFLSQLSAH